MENKFEEEDIKSLFPEENEETPADPERESFIKKFITDNSNLKIFALKLGILFILIFFGSYIGINYNALAKKLGYFYNTKIQRIAYTQSIPAPTPDVQFDPASPARLVIPKIGVDAPIIWNASDGQFNEKLLEGVVHVKDTALPGVKGNIFIMGHSSYYAWSSSPYKDIFALLPDMANGDKIYIQYAGHTYTYQINQTKVVSPKEVSVMDQTGYFNLTLMTCVPVGTNINRLIIVADQIS